MSAGRTINSLSKDWGTPEKYVTAVRKVLGFIHLDPCSNTYSIVNAKTEYLLPINGLKETWNFPTIYVNPPYGRDKEQNTSIKNWLEKCYNAHTEYQSEVLALVPVASNTSHWKNYVWNKATAICFLYDTRLKFMINGETKTKGAPMSCAMIYWGKNFHKFQEVFSEFGAVINL